MQNQMRTRALALRKWDVIPSQFFSFSFMTLLLLGFISGCASTASVQNAPLHAGIGRTFNAGFDRTLKAAREAINEAGLSIESTTKVNDATWMILAKKPGSMWSYGELVRVTVARTNDTSTEVRVYTKKRVSINITAKGDYSNAILSNIELKLAS
jgi:hypothetical protein